MQSYSGKLCSNLPFFILYPNLKVLYDTEFCGYRLQGTPAWVSVFMALNLALAGGACGSSFLSSVALTGVIVKFTATRFRLANEDRTSVSLTAKSDLVTMKTG